MTMSSEAQFRKAVIETAGRSSDVRTYDSQRSHQSDYVIY